MSETTTSKIKPDIENENKCVLKVNFDAATLIGWERTEIRQAYLHPKPYPRYREECFSNGNVKYTTNVKTPSSIKGEDYEKEESTLKPYFDNHWIATAEDDRLSKTRYTKVMGDETWCVDFFKDPTDGTYFVMAEVEMPTGRKEPHTFPIELANSITLHVDKGDRSFSSRKLANQSYARQKLNQIKNKITQKFQVG